MYDDAPRPRAIGDDAYRAHAAFEQALRRSAQFAEMQARAAGVTPRQHRLLLAVRGHPSYPWVSVTELARALHITLTSASELAHRAVSRELLIRQGDTLDRRRALISLSPQGAQVLEQITYLHRRELRARELRILQQLCNSLLDEP